ncbi:hypothetical protein [Pseudomonas sp. 22 E 5]|uniref:hypothetical protein n=1 Tax=Pseudomonas brassicacearum TaxID=930166 RepID=UPI0008129BC2|nr:hypothetical protein [Pseudomonas brassicacearum]CAH0153824.1 hypothetical protein SRABI06_00782 [Pseudomonas brassicacearum]CRM90906.1 hypothetical protein [Pseudomonas sp. 22 E 5]
MRLADFIIQNMEPILQQWKDFARRLRPAAEGMDMLALQYHAEHMLRTIAADLQTFQNPKARILRSHGNAPRSYIATSAETGVAFPFGGYTRNFCTVRRRAITSSCG